MGFSFLDGQNLYKEILPGKILNFVNIAVQVGLIDPSLQSTTVHFYTRKLMIFKCGSAFWTARFILKDFGHSNHIKLVC